jgi:acetate kinase
VLVERAFPVAEISSPAQAQHVVADWLIARNKDYAIVGIGHRAVHGGPVYSHIEWVDAGALTRDKD